MRIMKCASCGSYTLAQKCQKCGGRTVHAQPPKFSPEDKYGKYRRMMKKEME